MRSDRRRVAGRPIPGRCRSGPGRLPVRPSDVTVVASMLAFVLGVAVVRAQAPVLFPTTFQPSLSAIIASAVPGDSNMHWQLAEELPPDRYATAGREASYGPAAPPRDLRNAALLRVPQSRRCSRSGAAVRGAPQRRRRAWIVPLILLHGGYLGMAILQQPHARLVQIVAPATFVTLALIATSMGRRAEYARRCRPSSCWHSRPPSTLAPVYAHSVRDDARAESKVLARLAADLGHLPPGARVAIVDIVPHAAVAHALRPRPVLVARTKLMSAEKVRATIARFRADVVLAPNLMDGMRPDVAAEDAHPDVYGFLGPVLRQVPERGE